MRAQAAFRRVFGTSLVVLLIVAATIVGTASSRTVSTFKYVALGDSYSAGEGVDPYLRDGFDRSTGRQGVVDNRCHRSSRAYATWIKPSGFPKTLYALASGGGKPGSFGGKNKYGSDANVRLGNGVSWAFWACSGAITTNVLPSASGGKRQSDPHETYDPKPQLDLASLGGANLVAITIGGNDVGFVDIVQYCAVRNCNTGAFVQGRTKIIDDVKGPLEDVYRAIAKKAPDAKILVLGYPQLFPASAAEQSCAELSVWLGEQDMLRKLDAHFNDVARQAVADVANSGVDVQFVPVADRFKGHEVCGNRGSWLNGPSATFNLRRSGVDDQSFHPNRAGQQEGYAAAVNAVVDPPPAQPVVRTPTVQTTVPVSATARIGDAFESYCQVAWPTAPIRTSRYIQMTMQCDRHYPGYLLTVVLYGNPSLNVTPSTGRIYIKGQIVDLAESGYGFKEVVVQATTATLPH